MNCSFKGYGFLSGTAGGIGESARASYVGVQWGKKSVAPNVRGSHSEYHALLAVCKRKRLSLGFKN